MSHTPQYSSDFVEVSIEKKPHCVISALVKAKAPLLERAAKQALQDLTKDVSVPGFRKGKAPQDLVEKNFAKALEERKKKILADLGFQESQTLIKIPVIKEGTISFKIENIHPHEALFRYTFETVPSVPDIDYGQIQLDDIKEETPDETMVAGAIDGLLLFFAKWNVIEDRGVEEKDFITFDMDLLETPTPREPIKKAKIEVSDKGMAKWMKDLCLGMRVNDSKESLIPSDEQAEEKVPPQKIKLTIKQIEQPERPPLDDTFALRVGVKTVGEMRKNLTHLIQKQMHARYQHRLREQLAEALLTQCQFDLPQSVVEKELQTRIKQLLENPRALEAIKAMSQEEQQQKVSEIKTYAEHALRLYYICDHIIAKNNLSLSPQKVSEEVRTPLDALFTTPFTPSTDHTPEQKVASVSKMMLSTAEDFILTKLGKL